MRTLRVSVRRLVEFLLRTGDIDAESAGHRSIEAMLAGSEIHRRLQTAGGDAYQAEVPLAGSIYFPAGAFSPHAARLDIAEDSVRDQDGFFLALEGRADGIVYGHDGRADPSAHSTTPQSTAPLLIDEIKGSARDVAAIDTPDPLHVAQALCYAYLYLRKTRGAGGLVCAFDQQVAIRITYASMSTGEVRPITRAFDAPAIETWFFELLQKAERWAAWRVSHDELRERSLATLAFPFEARGGQRQLMDAVAATIRAEERLFAQAPTGSGKTIATLYPALKAVGANKASRIAFLTAKTMTREPVLSCLDLLKQQGVGINVLVMTARNKICPLRSRIAEEALRSRPLLSLCNPAECPLARGHYNAANDALFELLTSSDTLDATRVAQVAAQHHVCPYELQRDAARWADVIVCDYHYAFAPSASLFGLTDVPHDAGTLFLVDESHNLPDRLRQEYSTDLTTTELADLERLIREKNVFERLEQAIQQTRAAFPTWNKALPAPTGSKPAYQVVQPSDAFSEALGALMQELDTALEQVFVSGRRTDANKDASAIELYLSLRDLSVRVRALFATRERAEVGYVSFLSRIEGAGLGRAESRKLTIFCVDPSHDLDNRLLQAKAAVFFSGTLLPLDYYRKLLAARKEDPSLTVASSFDLRRQEVFIGTDVSARFSRRGPELYERISTYLLMLTRTRPGNYLVFLPSYTMTNELAQSLAQRVDSQTRILRQRPGMKEREREEFVCAFRAPHAAGSNLLGLCVLGGIFGESIDLPHNMLVGVVVVGTGLPAATAEREIMRTYYDAKTGKGFAFAYTYPGLTKVLQAAGRLMRTEQDHGTVLLLDDRFMEPETAGALPKDWKNVRTCTLKTFPRLLTQVPGANQ